MERIDGLNWRKSRYSGGNGGACVEIAGVRRAVLVRDSKNPDGPPLVFGHRAWTAFAVKMKARA
jgi:hypothetical protein